MRRRRLGAGVEGVLRLSVRAPSTGPGQGVVSFEHRAYKQDGTLVCRAVRDALMQRRPETA